MSCASCHHALTDTGDGWSLPVGEGSRGSGSPAIRAGARTPSTCGYRAMPRRSSTSGPASSAVRSWMVA
ncbi:MAG: hypothetical protein B7Z66_06345 [Chromatiales bacterium 21-64-14]|nr:MAG: hypothetical protein B7Z66_06345 [Chromatiales bacterium 21-64-14]